MTTKDFAGVLGTGIYLDPSLDFEVDSSGDISSINSGIQELQKDLALQSKIGLNEFLGETPDENVNQSIKDEIENRFLADPRVDSVAKESIQIEWKEDRKSLNVDVPIKIVTVNEQDEQNVGESESDEDNQIIEIDVRVGI